MTKDGILVMLLFSKNCMLLLYSSLYSCTQIAKIVTIPQQGQF